MNTLSEIFSHLSKETKVIYGLLQKKGPLTKNDLLIPFHTNLSTLNRMIQPLEDGHLIVEAGIGESSGGRKPILYDLNPTKFYVVGIDIARPYTQIIVANAKMDILSRHLFEMDENATPPQTVRRIAAALTEAFAELKINPQMILGVGLGTVGPLERDKGIMINPINFAAPGWVGAPIKDLLETELHLPVLVDNGANTAILAEALFGQGRGFPNIAYFNCSVGIRTAATSAGVIVRSINDTEDAFAHMVIDVKGEPCDCGNYGCVECYASIYAIVRHFNAALKQGRVSSVQKALHHIDYVDICGAAESGDELAKEIINNAAVIFGVGLANYINLLNPGLVIINGPLVSHSDLFYQTCTNVAIKRLYLKNANRIIFSKGGRFGDDAIALGAAAMVIEERLS